LGRVVARSVRMSGSGTAWSCDNRKMAAFSLPVSLADAAKADDTGDHREWVAGLEEVVRGLAERWSLGVGEPFQPGGSCSWVAPARNASGEELVLKVGWLHEEARHEPDALRLWNGNGAVLIHAADEFDDTSAMLLERCVPGTMLGLAKPEAEQDVVVAALLQRLWVHPGESHPFRPLQTMCDKWAAEFEDAVVRSPVGLDPGLARESIALLRTLPTSAPQNVLLCTDLHAENILAAEREPWLVIDPKPYVGDPAYDVLQHMLNAIVGLGPVAWNRGRGVRAPDQLDPGGRQPGARPLPRRGRR
jgi:streptomycin 6-kinase